MLRQLAIASAAALILTGLVAAPSAASPAPPPGGDDPLAVYTGTVDREGLAAIVDLGVDRHELVATPIAESSDRVEVQVILSGDQAAALNARGAELSAKQPAAQRRSLQATDGVYRQYYPEGGLLDEIMSQAAAHPGIAQFRVIGQTTDGNDIGAVRVTGDIAKQKKDGKRPTTIYVGAQHAREWITPEMVRRLLDLYLNSYGTDERITDIIDSTELWFVPVANPDGYDFTFTEGNRLWRKNLRDNNGDGVITTGDGVDLNRNFATRWGYDNEGSSPNPASETYRGPGPNSEAETQALDSLFATTTAEFLVNYHSAAELLLHGIGWQVSTPSPDDVIYEAMVGDDADPAIEGYDPDISAELYTTNGDTDTHAQEEYGTLGFTPEMTTCETVSNSIPDDEWVADDCQSGFNFPDDEELIQAEFEKNIPFALAVAESALDPDDPVSVVDREAEDFRVDSFEVSYGDPQPVAVTAKRSLKAKSMFYSINGGATVKAKLDEWAGGERYGFENTDYYAEYRGVVTGASPGDSVEVWFTAQETAADVGPGEKPGKTESEHFTYELAQDSGSPVLVLANEDYTGVNPTYPAGSTAPKYLDEHVAALEANGVTPATWDVDAQGVPHDLGVLSHFDGVIWYLGDNRLTQDPEDFITDTFLFGPLPDLAVAERQQYLTMSVRDYLNEGGKLAHSGETSAYFGLLGDQIGGIYYGLDGAPEEDCVISGDFFSDCLLLADDFTQYWLGANSRTASDFTGTTGIAPPLEGFTGTFGGPATVDNPVDEAGAFVATSDVLPVDEFPQFASEGAAEYASPYDAVEGEWAAAAGHVDFGYQRLARTFDLTGVSAADAPAFEAQIAFNTEPSYDNVIVEVHTVGQDNWTTLASPGETTSSMPAECAAGFLLDLHPFLLNYITPGSPCTPASPGSWNRLTGSTNGWIPVSFDLSAYAGQQIELVVSYVTDPASGGLGAIIDDTKLVVAGNATQAEGFETGLGAWQLLGAPEGSPANLSDWERAQGLATLLSTVTTPDSILFGFGFEQLDSDAAREDVVARILTHFAG
ncbi:M14 family metallopeptidase [Agromyces humatus]|uniref:M14 family metallopeptidase n=1 Tax=Agromyces humatus TaxID=279573 RepID=A0ABP4WNS6_9MICO|nr:M14 family metallopeptidase [Agromyces humatus]